MFYCKVIIFLFIFLSHDLFAASIKKNKLWATLLNISDYNDQSQVNNPHFFISSERTLESELNLFKEIINGNRQKGQELVCAFPARYAVLRQSYSNLKIYDLNLCPELKKFLRQYNGDQLSLAVTSEYYGSPSSAFGHIMLILHQNNTPDLGDHAIHFAAKTSSEDSFLKYSIFGLTGRYPGYYIIEPFFNKVHEYTLNEQRHIYINKLSVSPSNVNFLKYYLFELNKAQFGYYFLNQNCAYRIDHLLSLIIDIPPPKNTIFTLPSDVFRKYRQYTEQSYFIEPSATKVVKLVKNLNDEQIQRFNFIIESNEELLESDSSLVKRAVFSYRQFQFKTKKENSKVYSQNLLNGEIDTMPIKKDQQKLIERVQRAPHSFALSFEDSSEKNSYILSYLPIYNDIKSFQNFKNFESELKLLNLSLSYNSTSSFKFNNLDIISLKVFSPINLIRKSYSWQFYSGINDKKFNYSEIGFGHTFNYIVLLNYFINIGYESNIRETRFFLSPELNLFSYLNNFIKTGINVKKLFYREHDYALYRFFMNFKLSSLSEVLIQHDINSSESNKSTLSFRFSF